MTSAQFIEFLENKLESAGIHKIIPNNDILTIAYHRAARLAKVQKAIDEIASDIGIDGIDIPNDLEARIKETIQNTTISWDMALFKLASQKKTQP